MLLLISSGYVHGQCGKYLVLNNYPWGSSDDQVTMDAVFGVNGWTLASYSSSATSIFSPSNCFVMLEGSESGNPIALNSFLIANNALIENWVASGGRLFINAGPNEGGNITCGFSGTVINYNAGPYCNTAFAVNGSEAIFVGPYTPISTVYTGNFFSHASISGTGLTNLLTGTNPAPAGTLILAYKKWGSGVVFFGGLTQPGFWGPQPNATNLWKNILSYVNVIPTFGISCSVTGSSFCTITSAPVTVNYTAAGTYSAGNTFTAQLSDGIGSFASALNIGSVTSTTSGTINATIPAGTANGLGYRIRVIASNPIINGTNNGSNLVISSGVLPTVSIVTDHPNPICAGVSVMFTATPVNGGASPSYQWKKNGSNVGTNTNTYTNAALLNGDVVSCVLTSNATCLNNPTAVSNNISTTVNQPTSSTTNVTVCSNDLPYVWNNNSYSTAGSYPLHFTNAAGCDSLATLNLSVNTAVVPAVSIVTDHPNPICAGVPVIFTATPVNGGASPSYQWKKNGNDVGTDSNTYTDTGLSNTAVISCVLTSNATCITSPTATSNNIATTVNQPTSSTTTITVCSNDLPYVWNNNSYSIAGSYPLHFTNAAGCDSLATLNLSVNTSPTAGITNNTATTVLNCTYTSISVTATGGLSYAWSNGLGNNASATITSPGQYSVLVTSANTCTATTSISITQNLAIPVTPPAFSGIVNVCPYVGDNTPLTYSVAQDPLASSYQWIVPNFVTLISGQGTNSITVTIGAGFTNNPNKVFKVKAISDCGSSAYKIFYLATALPNTASPIVASGTNICPIIGTVNTITYTIPKVIAATSYIWAAQAGNTVINHPNGPGINDTTVQVSFGNSFTSSPISVQAVNDCGTSGPRSLNITRSNPSIPGLINGSTNICENIAPGGLAATYSIADVTNATSYTWAIPAGAIGFIGQGTNTISFIYPAGFASGSVSVTATNGCGTGGSRTLLVSKLNPAIPSVIDVIEEQPCPGRIYSYTLSTMPAHATSVQWTVPSIPGVILVSGQGTSSINVSYPDGTIQGVVTAQAFNNCGTSTVRQTAVKLPACPPPGFAGKADDKQNAKSSLKLETTSLVLDVNVFPNPTTSDFSLLVKTAEQNKVIVRLFDLQGRQLKTFQVTANEITKIGNDLKAGVYMLEITEGNNKSIKKLVKQ